MEEKVTLRAMRCPSCGAPLKAENAVDTIVCVYCDSSVVPVLEASSPKGDGGLGGVIKVEGIKTSSSALAYIEQFFEEYDWDAFAYAQALSVAEIDSLARSLKQSSADDKYTWFVCFKALSVPFLHKVRGCRHLLDQVIEEYRKDSLDAYSMFDAYRRVTAKVLSGRADVVQALEKHLAAAIKYGASGEEVNALQDELDDIRSTVELHSYTDVDAIPAIQQIKAEKNARIVQDLAAQGINARQSYEYACSLMESKNYVQALTVLRTLRGYSDTDELIEKLNRYYLIDDVLEIEGVLYYFRKENLDSVAYNLYRTTNGTVDAKPFVKNIANIITNYADLLYFLNASHRLCRCNLATGVVETVGKRTFDMSEISVSGTNVYLVAEEDLVELDMRTGNLKTLAGHVRSILQLEDRKLVYTLCPGSSVQVAVMDLNTLRVTVLGGADCEVEAFVDNSVVFTRNAPDANNKYLYIQAIDREDSARIVEKNIYSFCAVLAGKLFYYVGNAHNRSLININCDGTERKEWPLYISKVLFEQGGWVYFIRKVGYNAILCKSCLDGSKFKVIAADIDEFVRLKNGYLYYINDRSALVKVRMDGSNLQTLCDDVKQVLAVKEEKIVFVSADDRHTQSIYAVDFTGSGKIKLAYNVQLAKEYDENAVCYIAQQGKNLDVLYRLDVKTNRAYKLLEIQRIELTEAPKFPWALLVLIAMVLLTILCFSNDVFSMGVICSGVAILALVRLMNRAT